MNYPVGTWYRTCGWFIGSIAFLLSSYFQVLSFSVTSIWGILYIACHKLLHNLLACNAIYYLRVTSARNCSILIRFFILGSLPGWKSRCRLGCQWHMKIRGKHLFPSLTMKLLARCSSASMWVWVPQFLTIDQSPYHKETAEWAS